MKNNKLIKLRKQRIDIKQTLLRFIVWLIFFLLLAIPLTHLIPYLANLEEPLKLFGVIWVLMLSIQWFKWVGFPEIVISEYFEDLKEK